MSLPGALTHLAWVNPSSDRLGRCASGLNCALSMWGSVSENNGQCDFYVYPYKYIFAIVFQNELQKRAKTISMLLI